LLNFILGYLGEENKSEWLKYDATELLLHTSTVQLPYDDILIDVGTSDTFYINKQLLPEDFENAGKQIGQKITLRLQDGYDHSYYFVSTFLPDHILFHANRLNA
jgi:S-formylglutathione hydrolase FrmB